MQHLFVHQKNPTLHVRSNLTSIYTLAPFSLHLKFILTLKFVSKVQQKHLFHKKTWKKWCQCELLGHNPLPEVLSTRPLPHIRRLFINALWLCLLTTAAATVTSIKTTDPAPKMYIISMGTARYSPTFFHIILQIESCRARLHQSCAKFWL